MKYPTKWEVLILLINSKEPLTCEEVRSHIPKVMPNQVTLHAVLQKHKDKFFVNNKKIYLTTKGRFEFCELREREPYTSNPEFLKWGN